MLPPASRRPPTAQELARQEQRSAAQDTLRRVLRAAVRELGVDTPSDLVLLELSGRRTLTNLRVLRGELPAAVLREALSDHGELLARFPRGDDIVFIRLDQPVVELGGVECFPDLLNVQELERVLEGLRVEEARTLARSPRPAVIRMLLTREGDVAYVGMPGAGVPVRVRAELMAAAYRLRFAPASVDGVEVDVWVEQPIAVRGPR